MFETFGVTAGSSNWFYPLPVGLYTVVCSAWSSSPVKCCIQVLQFVYGFALYYLPLFSIVIWSHKLHVMPNFLVKKRRRTDITGLLYAARFKVMQSHQLWYEWKAHMPVPINELTCWQTSPSLQHNPRVWRTDRRNCGSYSMRCITCSHTLKKFLIVLKPKYFRT